MKAKFPYIKRMENPTTVFNKIHIKCRAKVALTFLTQIQTNKIYNISKIEYIKFNLTTTTNFMWVKQKETIKNNYLKTLKKPNISNFIQQNM